MAKKTNPKAEVWQLMRGRTVYNLQVPKGCKLNTSGWTKSGFLSGEAMLYQKEFASRLHFDMWFKSNENHLQFINEKGVKARYVPAV